MWSGLPDGVLNIVHGQVPTVNAICDHPAIKAISFVGGNTAGQHIFNRWVYSFWISTAAYRSLSGTQNGKRVQVGQRNSASLRH